MKKPVGIFLVSAAIPFAAILTSAAGAQTPAPLSPDLAAAVAARTCPLPQIADSVAMEPIGDSGLMTVPVDVNGSTQQFLVDIGLKKPTTVSPELVAKLALPEPNYQTESLAQPGGQFGSNGLTQVRVFDARDVTAETLAHRSSIRSFGIGSATARHLQLATAVAGLISKTAPYQGYMTGSLFAKYDVELDFAAKRITWLTPAPCADPDQAVFWAHDDIAVLPLTLAKDGRYQLKAQINGHDFNAEIDTSSPHTVMRRDIAEHDAGLSAGTAQMQPLGDLQDGMHMQIYVHTFAQMIFGGGKGTLEADNVPVMIQNYSMIPSLDRHMNMLTRSPDMERIPDLSIGMDVLRHLHLYFVPGQGVAYVTAAQPPAASASAVPPPQ